MSALCLQNIALPVPAKYLQQLLMRNILVEVVTGGQLESNPFFRVTIKTSVTSVAGTAYSAEFIPHF